MADRCDTMGMAMRTSLAQARRTAGLGLAGALVCGLAIAKQGLPATAQAQAVAGLDVSKPATAAVDASGTIVPLPAPKVEVLGLDGPRESPRGPAADPAPGNPCPNATALSEAEARALVLKVAQEEDFYPEFVLSVATVESNFDARALSGKGAFGLMQLMPATGTDFNVDICQPRDNIRGGVRYLRRLHEKYKNPFFILAAYNAGEGAVQQAKGVPPISETVRFVADVMNTFYEWPRIEKPKATARRNAPKAEHASAARAPEESSRWSSGFVMHLD